METARQFGGVPERFLAEGLRGSGPGNQLIHAGDEVRAQKTIPKSPVTKGELYTVRELVVTPNPTKRGFSKLLRLEGIEGEFAARKFRLVEESAVLPAHDDSGILLFAPQGAGELMGRIANLPRIRSMSEVDPGKVYLGFTAAPPERMADQTIRHALYGPFESRAAADGAGDLLRRFCADCGTGLVMADVFTGDGLKLNNGLYVTVSIFLDGGNPARTG